MGRCAVLVVIEGPSMYINFNHTHILLKCQYGAATDENRIEEAAASSYAKSVNPISRDEMFNSCGFGVDDMTPVALQWPFVTHPKSQHLL